MDKSGNIVRNKDRLVVQDYTQIKGINFEETFAPVARVEVIQITLAFASYKDFKLFQMDVKSEFLNGFIEEKVYVEQLLGLLILHIQILFLIRAKPALKNVCFVKSVKSLCVLMFPRYFRYSIGSTGQIYRDGRR